jgi:hypothetical protein
MYDRPMSDESKTLACGCTVATYRDFIGRVLGRIVEKAARCPHAEHVVDHVVIMPGREHARPGD